MPGKTFKSYFFNRFLLPKVIIHNEPGRIISKTTQRYGRKSSRIRVMYAFEDNCVDLQLASSKKLGLKKSEEMWYKIGKSFVTRHLNFSGKKKIPKLFQEEIVRFILGAFHSSGLSLAQNIRFDKRKMEMELHGNNNSVCRKNGMGDIFAGIISGLSSFVFDKNIEADMLECCQSKKFCHVISKPIIKKKFIPKLELIKVEPDYNKLNFKPTNQRAPTFSDFVKFKKIEFKDEKYQFLDETLLYMEISFFDIIYYYFKEYGIEDLYEPTIKESAKNKVDIFSKKNTCTIKFVCDMLSAFGWGIVTIKKNNNKLKVHITNPPYTRFNYHFLPAFVAGAIESIEKRKLKIDSLKYSKERTILAFNLI